MVTVSFLDAMYTAGQPNNRLGSPASPVQVHLLNVAPGAHRIYRRKQCLVEKGQVCTGLYLLRSGSAKGFHTSAQSHCVITDFFYPGDIIGLDALDKYCFVHSVQFLESSSVCYISLDTMTTLLAESADFRTSLLHHMSRAINHAGQLHTATSHFSSQQRLASFLLYVSSRYAAQGCSANEFSLTMTRADIANYLGMAVETLSRLVSKFQHNQLIQLQKRFCVILNRQHLEQIAYNYARAENKLG